MPCLVFVFVLSLSLSLSCLVLSCLCLVLSCLVLSCLVMYVCVGASEPLFEQPRKTHQSVNQRGGGGDRKRGTRNRNLMPQIGRQ